MAKNIATNLQNMGYSVFFDYDSMHNNEFDKQIYVAIKNSKDFILVLTENALDRCFLPDDWVAREVLYAKEHKKNIILATDAERFNIIRKTKCFRILERNAKISKTKRNFSRLYPTPQKFKKIDRLRRNEIHLKAVRTSS